MERMPSTPATQLSDFEPVPEKRKSGWLRPVVYLVVLAVLGYVAWRVYQKKISTQNAVANQANAQASRPVPVQAAMVEERSMPIYLTALGTVTPYYTVTIKARVSGQLDKVNFTEGQNVRIGQTIMVVDPKPYKAALDQAKGALGHDQALLNNAEAEYTRYKGLFDAGVVSKEQLDLQQSNLGQYQGAIASDKAAIETAQLQLDWCSIQSPIDGKIGLRLVDPGNIVTANTTSLVIVNQFEPIAVYFTLPENDLPEVLAKLRGGEHIVAEAWDRGDTTRIATGELLTADNQIDTTTGTDKLKAVFSNANEALFPNEFVNIHLVLEQRKNAVVVPTASIQTGIGGIFLWSIQPNKSVKMQPIKVDLAEGQQTIVSSGINVGDQIVIDGADRLRDDSKVVVTMVRRNANPTNPSSGTPEPPVKQPSVTPDKNSSVQGKAS